LRCSSVRRGSDRTATPSSGKYCRPCSGSQPHSHSNDTYTPPSRLCRATIAAPPERDVLERAFRASDLHVPFRVSRGQNILRHICVVGEDPRRGRVQHRLVQSQESADRDECPRMPGQWRSRRSRTGTMHHPALVPQSRRFGTSPARDLRQPRQDLGPAYRHGTNRPDG
jgi:hypothetical protein